MAQRNSTLTDRAARIRPDYAPMQAAPNPHADEARKALMDYGAQLLHNPPRNVDVQHEHDAPIVEQPNDDLPDLDLLCHVLEKHGEISDDAKISSARLLWPDLGWYAEQMHIGVGMWRCEAHGIYCERDGVVVIEVKGETE